MSPACGAIKEDAQTDDEERSERNEKAIAEGRDAYPIGIAGNENVESEKGCEERSADGRFAAGKEKKDNDGGQKNRRPKKQTVIRREKYLEQGRGEPRPVPDRDIAGFESPAINVIAH